MVVRFAVDPLPSTVLVVDDEPAICKLLATLFKSIGLVATTVATAEDALPVIERQRFACLVTDKNLPGMDGIELVRAMRVAQPHCACIVVTGYASHASAIEALQLGAFDYIEKPFHNTIVLERIKRVIACTRAKHEADAIRQQAVGYLEESGKTPPPAADGLAALLNSLLEID